MEINENDILMQLRMEAFITDNKLANPFADKILVAVSGGIDSIVLHHILSLFCKHIAVCHCNFSLRGSESDGDEDFVKHVANTYGHPFFSVRFDTKAYAAKHKISIQMAARELRYQWFDKLRSEEAYDYIAIGHNANDTAETFFINLLRGTGIRGLTGISVKQGHIIRPLLFASRPEITEYGSERGLSYREDSSNASDYYLRNHLRHHAIPLFQQLSDRFVETMRQNTERVQQSYSLLQLLVSKEIEQLSIENDLPFVVRSLNIDSLQKHTHTESLLYEWLSIFGFKAETISDIYRNLQGLSGAVFLSDFYRIIRNRNVLILTGLPPDSAAYYHVHNNDNLIIEADEYSKISVGNELLPGGTSQKGKVYLDTTKLAWPLRIRRWQNGDFMYPQGMQGRKKISDLFTDLKLSLVEKEYCWMVESAGQIVCVLGHRTDRRFAATEQGQSCMTVQLQYIQNSDSSSLTSAKLSTCLVG